jgi:hypothetical protein
MASSVTALDDGFPVEGLKTGNVVGGVEKAMEGRGIPNDDREAGVETTPVFYGVVVVSPFVAIGDDTSNTSALKG